MKSEMTNNSSLYEILSEHIDEESNDHVDLWTNLGRSLGIDSDISSLDFWVRLAMMLAYKYHPDLKIDIEDLNTPKKAGRKRWYEDNEVLSKRICQVAAIKHVMKEKGINEVSTACRVLLSENNLSDRHDYQKLATRYRDLKRKGIVGIVERLVDDDGISEADIYDIFFSNYKNG
ncbi:MAG: hypothetical protein AB2689_00090 [Candidatus Thiodiazotropha taylori]